MKPKFHTHQRQTAEETQGLKVVYAPARRPLPKWRWYLVLLLVTSPLLYFFAKTTYALVTITAPGNLLLPQHELRASVPGIIKRIDAQPGVLVSAEQPLVELQDPQLEEKALKLKQLLSALKPAPVAPPPPQRRVEPALQRGVILAEKILAQRRQRLQSTRNLFHDGAATRGEVDTANAQVLAATAELNRAQVDLAVEQAYYQPPPAFDSNYVNTRNQLQTELALVELQQARLTQKSPYSGRVIDIAVSDGEVVNTGTLLLRYGDVKNPMIMGYLNPKYAHLVKTGDSANVRFPNGDTIDMRVARDPDLTKRLPAELVDAFGIRSMSVLVELIPPTEWLAQNHYLIHGLPLEIRLQFQWPTHWWSRVGDLMRSAVAETAKID